VVPAATPDASPEVAEIVALLESLEVQATLDVRSFVEPSLYVPEAVNCNVNPATTFALAGITAIDVNVAGDCETPPPPFPPLLLPALPPPQAAVKPIRPSTPANRAVPSACEVMRKADRMSRLIMNIYSSLDRIRAA
jgi:hypothetical protein